ncbi:MAG: hypothetical protein HKN04_11585 [Rhodothermaceae bacterium]|nr:hypothetical protein [Rhodothermaceae bacterium]
MLALFLIGIMVGCDDGFVDPFLRDGGAFSVYGAIVSDEVPLTHEVRIVPVRTLPDTPTDTGQATVQLDAEVWSTDLTTGDSLQWTQRSVRYDDGSVGYLFSRDFVAPSEHAYRLTVRDRVNGNTATALVETPPVPILTRQPAQIVRPDSISQVVEWEAARLDSVTVMYQVDLDMASFVPIRYEAPPPGQPIVVDFVRDFAQVFAVAELEAEGDLDSLVVNEVQIRLRALNGAWVEPPEDSAVLAQPGADTNVEGGYGFVGGATYGTMLWRPDRDVMRAAGFTPSY